VAREPVGRGEASKVVVVVDVAGCSLGPRPSRVFFELFDLRSFRFGMHASSAIGSSK